jgi:AcrR family transcriptional regulator
MASRRSVNADTGSSSSARVASAASGSTGRPSDTPRVPRSRTRTAPFPIAPELRSPAPALGLRAQRTIERILDATKEVFLSLGYGGTTIDDIARAAGTSRASFYTYFPSKRDALLAIGRNAYLAAEDLVRRFGNLTSDWTLDDLEKWVSEYFTFLDEYGSFVLAWTHAAAEDDELRAAGLKNQLRSCRHLGLALDSLRGHPVGDPTQQGMLIFGMMDRVWSQCRVVGVPFEDDDVHTNAALIIEALLHVPEPD